MVEKDPDSTLLEYCKYWLDNYQQSINPSMMCELKKTKYDAKKKTIVAVNLALKECKF
jgi:hypothetical protein